MRFLRSHLLPALAAVILLAGPVAASATTLDVNLGGELVDLSDLTTSYTPTTYGGLYTQTAPYVGANGTISNWTSAYDTDPFVTQNFTVTNTTGFTQTYIFTVTSPIVPQLPSTLISGSVGLTITNTADASATLDDNGNAVYTALIDGGNVQTLFDPTYSLSCTPAFCSNSQSTDFGIPVPIGGPGATTSIGIRIQFDLSPGDSAGVTSVFNVVAIPEPVTGALLGAGVLALALASRRRG